MFLIACMFVGASFVGMRGHRYEYATLELSSNVGEHTANNRFDYTMSWRDSTNTVEATGTSKDWNLVPRRFFSELDLPTINHNQSQKLELLLTALGAKGWQVHTVQYGTDGEKRITSYLMMRQMQ
ncbi:MAG: hypothetical protein ACF8OB_08195, partial [Phycisphaeraceae bacterium JB051]